MSLAWKLRRLRAMGAGEVLQRSARAAQIAVERLGLGLANDTQPLPGATPAATPWLSLEPGIEDATAYREAADRILQGRFAIFARDDHQLGFPPQWNRDPVTGIEVPLHFGKGIDYRDGRIAGDVKSLWEFNRHLQFVTLAQAWHLTGDIRYANGCREGLLSWFAQCPYPRGIHWSSSLEAAFRLINWSASWHLLGGERSPLFEGEAGRAFRKAWLQGIRQHCHFVAGHFSRNSSANNHLLGELLGLYAGAATWPLWQESSAWLQQARDEFVAEALLQTANDGVNREQAVWYHRSVLELMLVAARIAASRGEDLGAPLRERTRAMIVYLASIMDAGGHLPNFGDEDGAVLLRFDPSAIASPYRQLIAVGAALFEEPSWKPLAGRFDDYGRWLLGQRAAQGFAALPAVANRAPPRCRFPDGGMYVLGDAFGTPEEIRIVADAAPLGYLAIAAHGHADALSFTLSVGGREVLIDPGTCTYRQDEGWRDYFRSTAAHNTVCVDGVDQSASGGPFLWLSHAQARVEAFECDEARDRLAAWHDGYRRLAAPVTHRREWLLDKRARQLRVHDQLSGSGKHRVALHWHFAHDIDIALEPGMAVVCLDRQRISLEWTAGATARLARAERQPALGWHSPRFGVLLPATTLVVTLDMEDAWEGVTTLSMART